MKTAGILVVYTEAFADTAIHRFTDLMRRVDRDAAIVVVCNNARVRLGERPGVTVLQGSNVLHEFGAWQSGLDHLRALPDAEGLRGVVLANDTFCHYRFMGGLEQAAFTRAAQRTLGRNRPDVNGDLARLPGRKPYRFDGVPIQAWIATYLFTLNRAALDGIGWTLQPAMSEVERWAPCGPHEDGFFAADLDRDLNHHFQAWLFGRPPLPGWRRCAPLQQGNHAMMQGKAHALICEQLLTANLLRHGASVWSVFDQPTIFVAQRLLARL